MNVLRAGSRPNSRAQAALSGKQVADEAGWADFARQDFRRQEMRADDDVRLECGNFLQQCASIQALDAAPQFLHLATGLGVVRDLIEITPQGWMMIHQTDIELGI